MIVSLIDSFPPIIIRGKSNEKHHTSKVTFYFGALRNINKIYPLNIL